MVSFYVQHKSKRPLATRPGIIFITRKNPQDEYQTKWLTVNCRKSLLQFPCQRLWWGMKCLKYKYRQRVWEMLPTDVPKINTNRKYSTELWNYFVIKLFSISLGHAVRALSGLHYTVVHIIHKPDTYYTIHVGFSAQSFVLGILQTTDLIQYSPK